MADSEVLPRPCALPAPPLVIALHDCIPGRVRWHVQGLRGDPALKTLLESGLPDLPGLHSARASTDTGNLLTLFDAELPVERLRERIVALIRREVVPTSGGGPGWHSLPADAVVDALNTSETGLTREAASGRLAEHGANTLPPPSSRSGLGIFLGQFQTLPVGLLIAAGAFSLLTGGMVEAAAILAVVGFNGIVGTVVESRSERTIRGLAEGGQEPAHVLRGGEAMAIPPEGVVPGDVIELLPGTVVPADARVFHARGLRVSEAMLTGESLPVAKQAEPVRRAAPLADRASMVYRGTAVTAGSGRAVVVETGSRTEAGRIQRLVGGEGRPPTPMQRQLDLLGRQLVWASLAACGAVMGLGGLRGIALFQLFRSAISLAVAAIPEGLPMVATTTLALGIEDMRKRGVLVRRLDAVEALASVDVICFDKTGTLTLNQMRVIEVASGGRRFRAGPDAPLFDPEGRPASPGEEDDPLARLLRVGVLCSDVALVEREGALIPSGSATEAALVRLALDLGLDAAVLREAHPRLAIRHRAEGYRFMATMHRQPGKEEALVAVKGSPAEVLDLCAWELREGSRRPMTAERREAILQVNEAMAAESLRVLGFAFGGIAPGMIEQDAEELAPVAGLTWVGLAGMADPVRPGMAALMGRLHGAGLRTVMMTGDQAVTAQAVARRLGLAGEAPVEVFDAADMETLSEAALKAAVVRAHIFARVSPAQKLRLIRALQEAGDRVAMIGDGINDSPALKAADIGIAMGGAASSEAAREVADVVLRSDDLETLAVAVERGRMTYVNVRKSIRYMLATNFSEILVVLAATLAGFGEPLTAMQMLWINLVGDALPGLGLAFEPPEPGLMRHPPYSAKAGIIGQEELGHLGAEGGMIAAGSLAAMGWGALRHGAGAEARTMAFGSLMTAQLLHALTARSARHGPLAGTEALPPNRPLAGLLLASAALQGLGLLVPGVRDALGVVPLGPLDFVASAAAGVLPYVANEALKAGRLPDPAS
ncbi:MAG TPA: HAD-IC family P-type ATPase [Acetobacteraceae bacterium]|nr:HAD-IC family P-type ATPase [Acetobacteraceae bacterium]